MRNRHYFRKICNLFLTLLMLFSLFTAFPAENIILAAANETELAPLRTIVKNHTKLDTSLSRLVDEGTATRSQQFASENNISLIDEKVRVIVECTPSQLAAISLAANALGAIVETSYENLLQITAPVSSLVSLCDLSGVRFIHLPEKFVPCTISEGVNVNDILLDAERRGIKII